MHKRASWGVQTSNMVQSHSICKHFRAISDKTSAEHRNRDACASATKRHQVQFVLVAWVAFRGIECARPVGKWGMGPRVRHTMTPAIQMEKWRKNGGWCGCKEQLIRTCSDLFVSTSQSICRFLTLHRMHEPPSFTQSLNPWFCCWGVIPEV